MFVFIKRNMKVFIRDKVAFFLSLLSVIILYKGNIRKWICRLRLTESSKVLIIPNESKKEIKITISNIYELKKYKSELLSVLNRYL